MFSGGLLGLVVGAVLGLTGAGGGIFAVPALVFGLGLDIRTAAPIALVAVGAAATLGAVQGLRKGMVRYKAAMALALAGSVTAPVGVMVAHVMPSRALNMVFVVVMLVVAYRMFASSRSATVRNEHSAMRMGICKISTETGRFIWTFQTAATLGGIGAITGLFTGMLGVGGGFIIVPALAHFSELRMHSVVATSLMVIALLSAVTVLHASGQGLALTPAAWAFCIVALIGMAAARLVAGIVPSAVLQRLFSIACVIVAGMMLMRSIG